MKGSVFLLFVVELIQTTSAWIVRRQVVPPAPPPSKFFRLESSVVGASDLLLPEPVIAPTLVPEPMRRRSPGEVFKQAFAKYDTLCKEKPLRTKSVTSAVISALGSVVSQTLMAVVKGKPAVINPNTVLAFFLTGLLYIGPFYHYWYEQLWTMGGWMERRYRSSPQTQTLAQIGVDQTIGVLAFFPIYFYVYEIFEALAFGRGKSFAVVFCLASLFSFLTCSCVQLLFSCPPTASASPHSRRRSWPIGACGR